MDASALTRTELPLIAAGVSLQECGAEFSETLNFAQWLDVGAMLKRVERSCQWWIGDWLRFGGHKWGDKYEAAAERLGMKPHTLKCYKSVAEQYPQLSTRIDNLPFSHHQIAAPLPPKKRARLLQQAADEGWSRSRLRSEILPSTPNLSTVADGEENPPGNPRVVESVCELIGHKFGTVYADPPWQYGNQATRASTDDHYGTLSIDELCALPVSQCVDDDAHLHLWTTNGFLPDSFRVMQAWGFEYRSCFVWVKPQMGIGNYWRVSHEFLLLGIRGDAKQFKVKNLKSWGEYKRGRHSAKPEAIRGIIETTSPGPYLELFGRRAVNGWTVMGNQINAQQRFD